MTLKFNYFKVLFLEGNEYISFTNLIGLNNILTIK